MKNKITSTLIAITLILIGLNSSAQILNPYYIFGKVINESGIGLPNQIVTISGANTYSMAAITDNFGNYSAAVQFAYPNYFFTVSYTDSCGTSSAQTVFLNGQLSYEVNFYACESTNPPNQCYADFYWEPSAASPLTLAFIDYSYSSDGQITSWNWNFGDGTSSVQQNPVHSFSDYGIYPVNLTIASENCTTTTTYEVWIGNDTIIYPEECSAYYYYDFQDLTVNFYDASYSFDGQYECTWDFGDGTTSIGLNPSHTYQSNENYLVTLTISGENCQSSYSDFVYLNDSIYPGCYASFWYYQDWYNANTVYFENYSSVGINANGTTTSEFEWNFGDGTSSNEYSPIHTYSQTGVYDVTLSVEDEICGYMEYTQSVYVENYPYPNYCNADFYFESDPTGYTFTFYDASMGTSNLYNVEWNFGDGQSSNEYFPTHTYLESGPYDVTFTTYSDTCVATSVQTIWVGENNWYPGSCQAFFWTEYNWENIYDINFMDFSYGNGPVLGYIWDFGDGYGSSLQNPHHIYDAAGEYLVTLTIFTQDCSSTFYEYVYIQDWTWYGGCQTLFFPNFTETLDVQFYDLTFPLANTWNWNFGDGSYSSEQNPLHTYSQPGVYVVTLETASDESCYSAFQMEIEIYEVNTKSTTYGGKINAAYAIHSSGASDINPNLNNSNLISLYPNPVSDELNVKVTETFENAQVQIISITGQVIFTDNFTDDNIKINTSTFANGLYITRINIDGNVYNQKFVK